MTHQESAATLEERFAALKATAKEAGCEIDIALTIGGVDVKELYRLRHFPEKRGSETLDGQITEIEQALADPRTQDAAQATARLKRAEDTAKLVDDLVKTRLNEYRVAIGALRSITTDPPVDDLTQQVIADIVTMERGDGKSPGEILMDLIRNEQARRERSATPEGEQPEQS